MHHRRREKTEAGACLRNERENDMFRFTNASESSQTIAAWKYNLNKEVFFSLEEVCVLCTSIPHTLRGEEGSSRQQRAFNHFMTGTVR